MLVRSWRDWLNLFFWVAMAAFATTQAIASGGAWWLAVSVFGIAAVVTAVGLARCGGRFSRSHRRGDA